MASVELLPQFRHDLIEQYCWYEERQDESLAQQFKAAVTAQSLLFAHRQILVQRADLLIRVWLGFATLESNRHFEKWLVFYRVGNGRLQAIRLLHGMRDLPRRLKDNSRH